MHAHRHQQDERVLKLPHQPPVNPSEGFYTLRSIYTIKVILRRPKCVPISNLNEGVPRTFYSACNLNARIPRTFFKNVTLIKGASCIVFF